MKTMPNTDDARATGVSDSSSSFRNDDYCRALFDHNPAAVLLLDAQGRIVEANQALQHRFGYDPLALRGQMLSLVMPDWDQPDLIAGMAQRCQPQDAIFRHAQGQRCEVVVALLPGPAEPTGVGCGYFLIARDVTALRRLQRRTQVQAEILARTHDAVVALDELGQVVCWNAGAARLYGVSAQAMAGQSFERLFEAPDRMRLQQGLIDAPFGAEASIELEVRRTDLQGRGMLLLLSLSRVAGVEGGRELWLVEGQDITFRQQAEQATHSARRISERQANHRSWLLRSAVSVGQQMGRKALLQHLAEAARVDVGAHQSAIWLLDGPHQQPAVRAVSMSAKYPAWRGAGSGLLGTQALACLAWRVLDQGAAAQLNAARLEMGQRQSSEGGLPPPRGWLAAPLFDREGRVMGLLQLADGFQGNFDEQNLVELQQVAIVTSAALEASADVATDLQSADWST